jgi:outer membrane protein
MLKQACLAAAITALISANSYADGSALPDKFEATYGVTRTNQSLINGVLINYKNDPTLNVVYENATGFASIQNGVGVWLVREEQIKSGVSLNYIMGRKASADARYTGMGHVAGSGMAYVWGEWQPIKEAVTVYANYGNALRESQGALGQWGLTLGLPLMPSVNVFADVSRSWASQNYVQTYYGVGAAQAALSGYAPFAAPASGVLYSNRQVGLLIEASKDIDIIVGYGKSSASALLMHSPLLDRQVQPLSTVVLNQRFNLD